MKQEPNSIAGLALVIIKVFGDNFSRLLRLFTVLQRGDERQKNGEFLLSRFLIKVHLIYGFSYKHFLCIEIAGRLTARLILFLPSKSTLMPKYSSEKNNTNPVFVSGFVLFTNGGEKEIRTLVGVLALTRFPVLSRQKFKEKQMEKLYIGI